MFSPIRDLPVERKLAAMLLLPSLALAVLSGVESVRGWRAVTQAESARQLVAVASAVDRTLHELAHERGLTALAIAREGGPVPPALVDQRARTDSAAAVLNDRVRMLPDELAHHSIQPLLTAALRDARRLLEHRGSVDWRVVAPTAAMGFYSNINQRLLSALGGVPAAVELPGAERLLPGWLALLDLKEQFGLERATGAVIAAVPGPRIEAGLRLEFQLAERLAQSAERALLARADPVDAQGYERAMAGDAGARDYRRLREALLARAADGLTPVDASRWFSIASARIERLQAHEGAMLARLERLAVDAHATALRSLATTLAATLGAIVGSLLIAVWLGRSVSRSVRAITHAAERLEIGDLSAQARPEGRHDRMAEAVNRVTEALWRITDQVERIAGGDFRTGVQPRSDRDALGAAVARMTDSLRRTMAESRASDERSRRLIESAPVAMLMVDREGRIVMANSQAERMFAYERGDLVGASVESLIPPGQRASHRQAREGFTEERGERPMGEDKVFTGLRRSGEEFPLRVGLNVFDAGGARFTVATVEDITETLRDAARRQAMVDVRNALQGAHDTTCIAQRTIDQLTRSLGYPAGTFWALADDTADDGVDVVSVALPSFDGHRLRRVAVHGDFTEYPSDPLADAAVILEAARARCTIVLDPVPPGRARIRVGSVACTPRHVLIVPIADGEHLLGVVELASMGALLPWQRQAVEALALPIAVTLRTARAGERLAAAHERLDTLFALSPDGLLSFDARDRVVAANPAACALFGHPLDALLGLRASDLDELFTQGRERRAGDPSIADLLTDGRIRFALRGTGDDVERAGLRIEMLRPLHRVLSCHVRFHVDGGAVAFLRDVTHEDEVARLKSEFVATAAHELRTPMTSVYGFAELILRRELDAERLRDLHGTIHRHCRRMVTILDDLLDLARIEARRGADFVPERISLRAVLHLALEDRVMPEDARTLVLHVPAELPDVDVDPGKIRRAIVNLLSNAYKYSSGCPGPVELSVLRRRGSGRDEVGVSVRDHGIGMTPEQLARLGEPFFRADASGHVPGTGLGVTIVREIVRLHGGELAVTSTPGEGTVATVWLPVAPSLAVSSDAHALLENS